ncbi:MAG TPA: hypothetical protein VIG25_26290 [Pyrinomonadaceae bacterium]
MAAELVFDKVHGFQVLEIDAVLNAKFSIERWAPDVLNAKINIEPWAPDRLDRERGFNA